MSERDMIISPAATHMFIYTTNRVDKYCISIYFSNIILTINITLFHKTIHFVTVFFYTLSLDKLNIP